MDTSRIARRLFIAGLSLVALVAVTGASAGTTKTYRVAFVADIGGAGPGISGQNVAGLRSAARDFDIEARVVVQPVRTSWTSVYRRLAREGYDLIITPFPNQEGAVVATARAYPEQRFVIGDMRKDQATEPWPANVLGLSAREEEIGFVVGYLAGLVERERPGRDVVGSVGGWNSGAVVRFIAGFRAGARRASPSIRLLNAYAFNFADPMPCRRIAEAHIAKGAGVVFNVAGGCGAGALAASRARGVWGIGVDQDQSGLGPHILTSAVKDVGLMTYRVVELLVQGRLATGGDMTLGLRDGVLRLGKVSPRVPPRLVASTLEIRRDVASGRTREIPTTVGR